MNASFTTFLHPRNSQSYWALSFIILLAATAYSRSISTTGSGHLVSVPVGRDSVYETSIVTINNSSVGRTFSFTLSTGDNRGFFEALPELDWLALSFDTAYAPPNGTTQPLKITTTLPMDSLLFNRRFNAKVLVREKRHRGLVLGASINITIETEPTKALFQGMETLVIAPSVGELDEEWDSLIIYNGSSVTDTVEVFWARRLQMQHDTEDGIILCRRLFLWNIPVSNIILGPQEGEWLYYKKNGDYFGPPGYIICVGAKKYLYCSLVEKQMGEPSLE